MAALPNLITVEQFYELPYGDEQRYELRFGEVSATPWPKFGDIRLRHCLYDILKPKLARFGEVAPVCPFRAIPEFDLRVADVAVIAHPRWDAIDKEDYLHGAPDLVITLISQTTAGLRATVSLSLANGTVEFWIMDPKRKSITVVRKDGTTTLYKGDTAIPLTAFGSDALQLADIFE